MLSVTVPTGFACLLVRIWTENTINRNIDMALGGLMNLIRRPTHFCMIVGTPLSYLELKNHLSRATRWFTISGYTFAVRGRAGWCPMADIDVANIGRFKEASDNVIGYSRDEYPLTLSGLLPSGLNRVLCVFLSILERYSITALAKRKDAAVLSRAGEQIMSENLP